MKEKLELLDQIIKTYQNGYGLHVANNSCGYVGVIQEPVFGFDLFMEIRNAAEVRKIKWGDDEFFEDFVGMADQCDDDENEANVWRIDNGRGFVTEVLTYPFAYE
jgi:hypothetical protein